VRNHNADCRQRREVDRGAAHGALGTALLACSLPGLAQQAARPRRSKPSGRKAWRRLRCSATRARTPEASAAPVELGEGESVRADGDGLTRSEAREADADALERVVGDRAPGAGCVLAFGRRIGDTRTVFRCGIPRLAEGAQSRMLRLRYYGPCAALRPCRSALRPYAATRKNYAGRRACTTSNSDGVVP